jgi:cardiolipin synthase A/B
VEVVIYNPVSAGTVLTRGLGLQNRNHRKLTIVDGRVAFLGGINISGVYTPDGIGAQRGGAAGSAGGGDRPFDEQPWRDTQVRIEGPVVEDLQKSFVRMWARVTKEKPLEGADLYPKGSQAGIHLVRAVESSPATKSNAMYVALISAIENAEQSVTITMAYFVPHDALLEALQAAARRGVKVRILLPSRTDNWVVLHAGRAYYSQLLEAGVQLYERENRLLHSKTATIDGVWSTVGSTNLDWRSLVYNEEMNAVVIGPEFASRVEASFEADLKRSTAITPESWARRPVADRMRETLARSWALLL